MRFKEIVSAEELLSLQCLISDSLGTTAVAQADEQVQSGH